MIGVPELEGARRSDPKLFPVLKGIWDQVVTLYNAFRVGTVTLNGENTTVLCKTVQRTSKVYLSHRVRTNAGTLEVPVSFVQEGTSFRIVSSSATDTSTVDWLLVNLKGD